MHTGLRFSGGVLGMVYIKSWCYYSPKPEIDSRIGKPALHGDFLNVQSCQEWDSTHQPVSGKWMDKHPTMHCVLLHLQSIPRLCGKTSIASAKYESTFQQHYRAPLLDPWGMLQAVKLIVLLITSGTVECMYLDLWSEFIGVNLHGACQSD